MRKIVLVTLCLLFYFSFGKTVQKVTPDKPVLKSSVKNELYGKRLELSEKWNTLSKRIVKKYCLKGTPAECSIALGLFQDILSKDSAKIREKCQNDKNSTCAVKAKDLQKDVRRLTIECKKGDSHSCKRLSMFYFTGTNVDKSVAKSDYYEKFVDKITEIKLDIARMNN